MRLEQIIEIFNRQYYDFLQDELKRKQYDPDEDRSETDSETSMQDFIISKFEAGQVSFDDAMKELRKVTPEDQMFFWELELNAAQDLMND